MASSLVISELMGLPGIKAPHLGPQPTHWLELLEIDYAGLSTNSGSLCSCLSSMSLRFEARHCYWAFR